MLLEYAAQFKCRSQRQALRTIAMVRRVPHDLHIAVLSFCEEVQNTITSLKDTLVAIRERKDEKEKENQKLIETERRLQAAQSLMMKGETLKDQLEKSIVEYGNGNPEDEPGNENGGERKIDFENELHKLQHEKDGVVGDRNDENTSATTSSSTSSSSSSTSSSPSPSPLSSIEQQLAALREQMEMFAKLQQIAALSGLSLPNASAASSPSASPLSSPSSASSSSSFSIPMAPPLTDDTFPAIAHDIPMAPPLTPPFSSSSNTFSYDIPVAPPMMDSDIGDSENIPTVQDDDDMMAVGPIATTGSSTSHRNSRRSIEPASHFTPSPTSSSSSSYPTSSSSSLSSSLSIKIYTRSIPGETSLSHSDLIKVAAAMKLRETDIPRSPGGTPMRRNKNGMMGGGGGGYTIGGMGLTLKSLSGNNSNINHQNMSNQSNNSNTLGTSHLSIHPSSANFPLSPNSSFKNALESKFKNVRRSDNFAGKASEADKENWET